MAMLCSYSLIMLRCAFTSVMFGIIECLYYCMIISLAAKIMCRAMLLSWEGKEVMPKLRTASSKDGLVSISENSDMHIKTFSQNVKICGHSHKM